MRRSGHPASVPALGAVLVAVTIAAAACGTVGQPEASRGRSGQAGPKSMPTANGPAAGSRGLALRTSARLLKDLALPLGSRPAGARELPDPLRRPAEMPGSSHLVQRHEVMAVPASAKWLLRHLSQHPPGGLISTGSGMSSGPSWPVLTFLSWSPRRLPAGLYQANLVVSVLPAGRAAALVRADAQVIWYPPRSRAEYVTPGRFAAARLWEHLFNPRPHTVRMIVTSRAMIARLAARCPARRSRNPVRLSGDHR